MTRLRDVLAFGCGRFETGEGMPAQPRLKPSPPRATRRTVRAGLAALTAGLVVFSSAAGPAFAAMSDGNGSNAAAAGPGSGRGSGPGSSRPGGGSASSGTPASSRSSGASAHSNGAPVERPDYIADEAQSAASTKAGHGAKGSG